MRLTKTQIQAIKATTREIFGAQAAVYLFGSRTDDARRGGDIDLLIETPLDDIEEIARLRIRFLAALKQKIGDQHIDLLVRSGSETGSKTGSEIDSAKSTDETNTPYVAQVARNTGVRL